MESVTLTWELLHDLASYYGGWTAAQLRILGVRWPPRKGWLRRKIGATITAQQFAELQRLRDIRNAQIDDSKVDEAQRSLSIALEIDG